MRARFVCFLIFCATAFAQSSQPSLTIYNQDFAVVRQELPLDLQSGVNHVNVDDITMHMEPDSVILRDPSDKRNLNVLEQNYRADPISQASLLSLYEGRTIDFEQPDHTIVKGKIIRSGYVRPDYFNVNGYNQAYQPEDPIIEIAGQLRFGLPGLPIFPDLAAETILKPRLEWTLATDKAGKFPAEFSYVTGGLSWQADYNIVAPEKGDIVDVVGWITMDNRTGKTFENARIKLIAGDVNKLRNNPQFAMKAAMADNLAGAMAPPVTEKAFDEYHLYTLQRTTTLRDRETKQVEFIHASGVVAKQLYIYDGARIDSNRYNGWNWENIRNDHSYGAESNPKVWVMREFVNSEANHLGMPLPKGRVRFYRSNDSQIEFTGENAIDHTARDEKVRIYTGNAFDLTGERKRTNYTVETRQNTATESFEIRVRNHKKEPVQVEVIEHLYRGTNWEIVSKSDDYQKKDSQTVEFPITIAPDAEKVITYTARYTW
ncbi:MAG: DUF4139 domain-containing protein [Candidatus Sulfotelmatobacter sp.]